MSQKQTVSPKEIEKIARLAKLHLSADQQALYTDQINAILEHVKTLESVDISAVEPLAHVLELVNVSAPDEVGSSLPRDQVLANVPKGTSGRDKDSSATDGSFYIVPGVMKKDR
ncbi:MAG: Asp-tRNA(Asn)/Glu-tRNA(Gln) amidotransferase subunit GatC [Candidatus Marinimicrobia bacterium]|nr:Asp-tRNA(Asn)/Glu-tRNA(Gln) amidotransferase subunit GatC [Candidatus Neomarinimicrobiota bacterium]